MADLSVSVVIPTFNSAATLVDTLRAVREQSEGPDDFELILADSQSSDGTQEIARKFGATILKTSKHGPAAARNAGLFHASGGIIVYLDSDTIPTRRWLHEITAPFRDTSTILVGGRSLSQKPESLAERFMSAKRAEGVTIMRSVYPFVESMNMAVRRQAAVEIGGWSEDMLTAEDADFTFRLIRKLDTKLVYAPRALVYHRERRTDDDLRRLAWGYGEGAAHMYLKHSAELTWHPATSARLLGTLTYRTVAPLTNRLTESLGLAPREEVWYSYYMRFWSWWFWCGFVSMYFNREYRPAPNVASFAKTAITRACK